MSKKVSMFLHISLILFCGLFVNLFSIDKTFAQKNIEGIRVYQKNIADQHKKKLLEDVKQYQHADNLWDILREAFTLPHYEETPQVQKKIRWFMNNPTYLINSAKRAAPYLYFIWQQVKKRHLPAELVLLPIVESGYNPYNESPMGALGIWQLMPGTAQGLGVKRDSFYDGRRDLILSTRAALNYLAYLQSFFEGNWLLALAAYNTGEGNVLAALKKNIHYGYDTDFWSLPLAQQTKDYVPSILALAVIIGHPDVYPLYFPPVRNAPYLAQIDVESRINLKYAATLAGLSYKKLMQLNSGFSKNAVTNQSLHTLILPIENVEQFTTNLARAPIPLDMQFETTHHFASTEKNFSTKNRYQLQPGDTIYMIREHDNVTTIAQRFHLNQNTILAANRSAIFLPGTHIILPTHLKKNVAPPAKSLTKKSVLPGDTIYIVRDGDTIEKIAKRFHTSPSSVRLINLVDNDTLSAGDKLIIPTHLSG